MRALLLALLFASTAAAQTSDALDARRPSGSSAAVRALAGAMVSLGLPVLIYYGSSGEQEAVAAAAVIAIPLTAAVGAHFVGTDGSGSFGRTLAGSGLGTLAGVALLAAGGLVCASGISGDYCFLPLAPGAVALVLGPAIGAGLRYRGSAASAAPVVLVGSGGERAVGVSFHIGL
ncbi:MAG TPA: hypothetical protein VF594_08505 [Rubricoccaceae bacterium]|jgi:hypothetical protein